MFSEAYKELCINNADRLREEWKPRAGDWVVLKRQPSKPYLIVLTYPALLISLGAVSEGVLKNQCIPLFQPRQLIEMLKERVRPVWVGGPIEVEGHRYWKVIAGGEWFGPDPATALLRAWLEVVDEEEK